MNEFLIPAIVLLAVFTESLSGFGTGLVAMPFLLKVIDVNLATPLISLISIITNATLTVYYRRAFNLKVVSGLLVASLPAIPLGVLALQIVDEKLMLISMGVVIVSYALYSLFELRLPEINSPQWAYPFGLLSGLLTGAYNIGGPPVIIYADCCRWEPERFKSNLQGFFLSI